MPRARRAKRTAPANLAGAALLRGTVHVNRIGANETRQLLTCSVYSIVVERSILVKQMSLRSCRIWDGSRRSAAFFIPY